MSRPDYTVCRQTDACLCPVCYDRKHGAPPPEVAELADALCDIQEPHLSHGRCSGFSAAEQQAETAEAQAAEIEAAGGRAVCGRCGYPAVPTPNGWAHAEIGDAAMCELFYANGR